MVLSGEDAFEKDLSKSPTLGRGKQGSKMDMMMMIFVHYLRSFEVIIKLLKISGIEKVLNEMFGYHVKQPSP